MFLQPGFAQGDLPEQTEAPYLWRQAVGGTVIGRPVVEAQSLVFMLDSGLVKAYSLSGKHIWDFPAAGRLSPFMSRSREGATYICRANGIFIAISRLGTELWHADIGGALSAPAVPGWDGRIFIPAGKKIICYTASGTLLWTRELDGAISAGPVLDVEGSLLLALENGDVLRISPFSEADKWRLPSPAAALVSAVSADGAVVLAMCGNGDIRKIDPARPGAAPADFARLPAPPLAAAGREGSAAVALGNGQALLLSADNGKILWTSDSHVRAQIDRGGAGAGAGAGAAGTAAAVIFDERGVFVLTPSGATGFSGSGRRIWFSSLKNASGVPAFDGCGALYSGGTDWILYAWKLDGQKLDSGRPASASRYGTGAQKGNPPGSLPPSRHSGYPDRFEESMVREELAIIRREVEAGRTGVNETEWLAFLMETAAGAPALRTGGPLINHRIQALQLLSAIGSSELIPWLAFFFQREQDPLVRAVAAQAIGGIGVDADGAAMQAFFSVATTWNQARDEQSLISVAAATASLCRYSGPQVFAEGMRILRLLRDTGPMLPVRRQARRELDSLEMR